MDRICKLDILAPAQAELEEIARVHMALSGPPVRDEQLRVGGYRYILAGKYLVIYRLLGDTVVVYHIAHGATDYPKLFRTSYF